MIGKKASGRRNRKTRSGPASIEDHSGYSIECISCANLHLCQNSALYDGYQQITARLFVKFADTSKLPLGKQALLVHTQPMPNQQTRTETVEVAAATIVIFRNNDAGGPPELLMVTRSRTMSFAGGAAVFPGGRVDPADFDLAATLETPLPHDEAAHRVAAIRETLEETGLAIGMSGSVDAARAREARAMLLKTGTLASVISAMNWQIDLDAVLPFARWLPKNEKLTRIFDTRFYLANLGTGSVDIAVDQTENTKMYWITAQGALDAAERGDLSIIFPTRRNLERLAQFTDFAAATRDCARHPVRVITPHVAERGGEKWLCIPDDVGYPITGEALANVMRG